MLLVGSFTYAQIQKGDVLIGGSLFISNTTLENAQPSSLEANSFNFSPRAGLFLSEKMSLGLIIGYDRDKIENSNVGVPNTTTENLFTFGAYMRNYKSLSEKFFFYLQTSILIGTGNADVVVNNAIQEADRGAFGIEIQPGVSYFFTDRLSLDVSIFQLGYTDQTTELASANINQETSRFFISGGLNSVGVGLSWFLR